MIDFMLVVNRQGKLRMSRWYGTQSLAQRDALTKSITEMVLNRLPKSPLIVEHKGFRVIHRRYASLYFIFALQAHSSHLGSKSIKSENVDTPDCNENDLLVLEWIHRFVETLDAYFGNVCELDLIFNYSKAFAIWDEMVVGGHLVESSSRLVVNNMFAIDDRIACESKK